MSRVSRERALFLGLCALQHYVDQARKNPLRGTIHLRALLALLAERGKGETNAYQLFWKVARTPLCPSNPYAELQHYQRGTGAQIQWIGIARDLGFPAVDGEFCRKVDEMVRRANYVAP